MSEQFNPNDWLTTAEAAAVTGYSQGHIRQTILRGHLNAIKKGKTWFVERKDLTEYVQQMRALGSAKHTPKRFIEN